MARRKSSHSFANGNCVEVEDGWRTASHSQGASNCAEVSGWRKASGCSHGECAEVAAWRTATLPVVAVRDTKDNGTGPVLTFTAKEWAVFTGSIRR